MIYVPVEHEVDPSSVPDAPLRAPAPSGGLVDVWGRSYLLRLLVRKEILSRYSGSFLGLLWSYVMPAMRFFIYFFVIGVIMGLHKDVPAFGIHMFAGLVFAHYFTETFSAGTRAIVKNRSILTKMPMPKEMFPVASMLVSAFHVIPGMVILTVAGYLIGWRPDPAGLLAGAMGFLIVSLLGTALALLFSAANVFFRDFGNIVSTLTLFVHFTVPMVYPYALVQARFGAFAKFYLLNPVAEAVLLNQRCFWVGATGHPARYIRTDMPDHLFLIGFGQIGLTLVILVFSQMWFSRLEGKFVERL